MLIFSDLKNQEIKDGRKKMAGKTIFGKNCLLSLRIAWMSKFSSKLLFVTRIFASYAEIQDDCQKYWESYFWQTLANNSVDMADDYVDDSGGSKISLKLLYLTPFSR